MSKEQEIIGILQSAFKHFQELPNVPPVDHERFKDAIDTAIMVVDRRLIVGSFFVDLDSGVFGVNADAVNKRVEQLKEQGIQGFESLDAIGD